jgi:hypothetical protein
MFLKQSQLAMELLSKENVDKLLSKNQLVVLTCIKEFKDASVGGIVSNTSILRPTVKQVIKVLLKFKKIERIGQGRSTRYRII